MVPSGQKRNEAATRNPMRTTAEASFVERNLTCGMDRSWNTNVRLRPLVQSRLRDLEFVRIGTEVWANWICWAIRFGKRQWEWERGVKSSQKVSSSSLLSITNCNELQLPAWLQIFLSNLPMRSASHGARSNNVSVYSPSVHFVRVRIVNSWPHYSTQPRWKRCRCTGLSPICWGVWWRTQWKAGIQFIGSDEIHILEGRAALPKLPLFYDRAFD